MNITVQIKNVYGNEMIYPACETSREFTRLTGNKTLSRGNLEIIKRLGYVVGVAQTSLEDA